jgi:phage recombination protein Bet
MNTELITTESSQLTPSVAITTDDIKKYLVRGNAVPTNEEMVLAAKYCMENNLNPWKKDCYFVKIGIEPLAVITSYEVALKRAENHPQYDNYECETKGAGENLEITCKVYRKDRSRPTVYTAFFQESAVRTKEGTLNKFWKKQPRFQLEKCAIAHALKRAFPSEFANQEFGDYPERESFEQSYSPAPAALTLNDWIGDDKQPAQPPIENFVTQPQIARLFARASELKLSKTQVKNYLITGEYLTVDPESNDYSTKTLKSSDYETVYEGLGELAYALNKTEKQQAMEIPHEDLSFLD